MIADGWLQQEVDEVDGKIISTSMWEGSGYLALRQDYKRAHYELCPVEQEVADNKPQSTLTSDSQAIMGHSAGLRAGTRVCENPRDNAKHLGQTGLQQLCSSVMELELTRITVCLLA